MQCKCGLSVMAEYILHMTPHMTLKVSFKSETLSTMMAGEWFLSRVNSHVILKVILLCETLSTVMAHVRLLLQCESLHES